MFYSLSDTTFTRLYAEEVEIAFSAIDCVLNREKAVYASTELTTGLRLYDVCRANAVLTRDQLKTKNGAKWFEDHVWAPNVEGARVFAEQCRTRLGGTSLVITPAPFTAPGWSQPEYLAFWETLIRTRIASCWFNQNWQYSNGCTFEFAVALDAGIPTCDANGQTLSQADAVTAVTAGVRQLTADGFDASKLRENLDRIMSISKHSEPIAIR